jgi:hypothetical protein
MIARIADVERAGTVDRDPARREEKAGHAVAVSGVLMVPANVVTTAPGSVILRTTRLPESAT